MDQHDIFGVVAFAVLCLGTAALVLIRKKLADRELAKKVAAYPTTWVHVGLPPPKGVDKALEIIKKEMPTWTGRYGGTIEWVKDPFMVGMIKAAGTVDDFGEPRIRLMYNDDITKTALAHELHHVWQVKYEQSKIMDGDPLLYAWVYATNTKIRAAMA